MEQDIRNLPMAEYIRDLSHQHATGQITRQEFLRWGAMFGASLPLLRSMAGPAEPALAAERTVAETPRMGGTLRCSAFLPGMTTIEPPLIQDINSAATVHAVFEQLVRIGPDLVARPPPRQIVDGLQGRQAWNLKKIRKGITFNNGAPFSADDVVWTFKLLLNPKTASSARSTLSYMTMNSVEKVDNYTVRFHLNRPVAVFPYDINNYMIVMLPKDWPGEFAKNPIGTGPYLLKELIVGDHATFTRNPNYWRKPLPYLDGVHITYAKSGQSEMNMLIAGQTDAYLFGGDPRITKRYPSKINLLIARSAAYTPFHMRSDMKPFNDNRVREAFKYVVNRQQLVKVSLQGYGDVGNDHMVAPVYPEYSSNGLRKQDYAKARALLAEAGYANGLEIDFYGVGASNAIAPEALAFQQMAATGGRQGAPAPGADGAVLQPLDDCAVRYGGVGGAAHG